MREQVVHCFDLFREEAHQSLLPFLLSCCECEGAPLVASRASTCFDGNVRSGCRFRKTRSNRAGQVLELGDLNVFDARLLLAISAMAKNSNYELESEMRRFSLSR